MKKFCKVKILLISVISVINFINSATDIAKDLLAGAIKEGFSYAGKIIKCPSTPLTYHWQAEGRAKLLRTTNIGFSFFNKSGKKVKIEVTSAGFPSKTMMESLRSAVGRITKRADVPDKTITNFALDINKPTELTIKDLNNRIQGKYKFETGKTIYVTWQPSRKWSFKDIFRTSQVPEHPLYPQTGPGQGYHGITDMCFNKNNNVTAQDIDPIDQN